MAVTNPYQTLGVSPQATQTEIKQAYRRLAKQFHPDTCQTEVDRDKIVSINGAYEAIGDPQNRLQYDRSVTAPQNQRQERTARAQRNYRYNREVGKEVEKQEQGWLKGVYAPVDRLLLRIIKPLKRQIKQLAADPFDDELLAVFQGYLEDSQSYLERARQTFTSQPNPSNLAGVAAHLYYCLDRLSDALEELQWFTLNFDDHHLHTAQELFRIAQSLREEAHDRVQQSC